MSPRVHGGDRQIAIQRFRLDVVNPIHAFRAVAIFKRGTKPQVIGIGFQAFPQNDVDGSGNGPSARFGGRSPHDFDFFNHLWRERFN